MSILLHHQLMLEMIMLCMCSLLCVWVCLSLCVWEKASKHESQDGQPVVSASALVLKVSASQREIYWTILEKYDDLYIEILLTFLRQIQTNQKKENTQCKPLCRADSRCLHFIFCWRASSQVAMILFFTIIGWFWPTTIDKMVLLASHIIVNKQVALKVVTLHNIKDPYVSENLKREPAIMAKLNHPIIVSVGDCYYLVLDFYPWRYLPTSVGMMTMMMPTLMLTMKLIAILMSTNKNGGNDGWGRQRVFVLCLLFQIIILPRHKIEVMFAPNHCDDQNSFFLSFQTRSSSWVDIVYLWLASLTGQVVVQLM